MYDMRPNAFPFSACLGREEASLGIIKKLAILGTLGKFHQIRNIEVRWVITCSNIQRLETALCGWFPLIRSTVLTKKTSCIERPCHFLL